MSAMKLVVIAGQKWIFQWQK